MESRFAMIMVAACVCWSLAGCDTGRATSGNVPAAAIPQTRKKTQDVGLSLYGEPRHAEFQDLATMISKGYEEELIEALERKPEMVNYEHKAFGTLLLPAASSGRLRVATYLLEHGANPNIRELNGFVPLLACMTNADNGLIDENGEVSESKGRIAVFDLLLNHGASPKLTENKFSATTKTERDYIWSTDSLFEVGMKYQRSRHYHSMERSWLIARLRHHMNLPVDAMLPLNANSLYLLPEPTGPK